jgi:hypothetical protein
MWALAGNVWSFLHRFALCTAILSGRYVAGTDGMGAFLALVKCHVVSPCLLLLDQLKDWMCAGQERAAVKMNTVNDL